MTSQSPSHRLCRGWVVYCGWQDYKITCKPSFDGIDMKITCTGKDKFMIKDYLYDLFDNHLNTEFDFSLIEL